jgi:uncharacterized cupredoxin-like copper-binding protein
VVKKRGNEMEQKMKTFIKICVFGLTAALLAPHADASTGKGTRPHVRAYELPGHDPIGKPGDTNLATRIIEVVIGETTAGYMLFEPDAINIERGSVVRFTIKNDGAVDHEFFLGSFEEVGKHQQWMRKHPDMEHKDPNTITIPSGETAELVWEFSDIGNLEFVCLIPGHREAGMWGVIMVHDHHAPNSKG